MCPNNSRLSSCVELAICLKNVDSGEYSPSILLQLLAVEPKSLEMLSVELISKLSAL